MTAAVCASCRTPLRPSVTSCPNCGLTQQHADLETRRSLQTVTFGRVTSKLVGLPILLIGLPVLAIGLMMVSTLTAEFDGFTLVMGPLLTLAGYWLASVGIAIARNKPRDLMNPWAMLVFAAFFLIMGVVMAVQQGSFEPIEVPLPLAIPAGLLATARLRRR